MTTESSEAKAMSRRKMTETKGAGEDAMMGPSRPPVPPGAKLLYVPLDGHGACDATVRSASQNGLDLDVFSPGCSTPVALSAVPLYDGFSFLCPPGHCFSPTKGELA